MQDEGRPCVCFVVPSPVLSRWGDAVLHHTLLQAKAMSTEVRSSLVDDLTAFTARLDGLRPDQHPDDLSSTLRVAFQQPELYDAHTSFLVTDVERTKALLEVFDKVRSVIYDIP